MENKHKSGFVNIVGNPNVGKSTLMNRLVGERISIITSKAQTTRHRIIGIVNTADMQIVYSDTPGVLHPNYKLQESMLNFSQSALGDADVLLYVTDVVEKIDKNEEFLQKVQKVECPVLLLINKIDTTTQPELEKLVAEWKELLPKAEIIPILSPYNCRFSFPDNFRRLFSFSVTSPDITFPFPASRFMIVREVTDLPLPLSPTRAWILPRFTSRLTSFTA